MSDRGKEREAEWRKYFYSSEPTDISFQKLEIQTGNLDFELRQATGMGVDDFKEAGAIPRFDRDGRVLPLDHQARSLHYLAEKKNK